MATNKELVEQAVGAIPKWMAFLDRKQAEQNLILEQMQDDEAEFAPKTLTQKLTDRFKSKPKPSPRAKTSDEDSLAGPTGKTQVKLEKETREKEEEVAEEEVVKETPVPQKPDTDESNEPVSSDDDQQMLIDKKNFNDLF